MRLVSFLAAVMIVAGTAGASWADAVDEAEAKHRGVSVERVQLDHAKDQIAELTAAKAKLQKQLADAQKQISDLQKQAAPAKQGGLAATTQNAKAATPPAKKTAAQHAADEVAFREHVVGMTLDDAIAEVKKGDAFGDGPFLDSGTATRKVYRILTNSAWNDCEEFTLTVVNGKVASFDVRSLYH